MNMRFQYIRLLYLLLCLFMIFITSFLILYINNVDFTELTRKAVTIQRYLFLRDTRKPEKQWTYICENNKYCKRILSRSKIYTLHTCHMICGMPPLWPMPKRIHDLEKSAISSFSFDIVSMKYKCSGGVEKLVQKTYNIFCRNILALVKNKSTKSSKGLRRFKIRFKMKNCWLTKLTLSVIESYKLRLKRYDDDLVIDIVAETYFGARHGLETLSQLIWFDDYEKTLKILHDISIEDGPSFPYRGLMLDTSRHYFSSKSLKRNLRGMAANKMNVFHWHITDAESFPFYSENFPNISKYGSYGRFKTYTRETIKEIVEYAKVLGIRVIMEVDGPAHTYEGWRYLNSSSPLIYSSASTNTGQLSPYNDEVYSILKKIYADMIFLTSNREIFHIGGDEVNMQLWVRNKTILVPETSQIEPNISEYRSAWVTTMKRMFDTAKEIRPMQNVMVWSSDITSEEVFHKIFNPKTTIIQFWLGDLIPLIEQKYKIVFSNVNAWYLDCGYGIWRSTSNEGYCLYNSWETIYTFTPWTDVEEDLVLGGEVCLWTETVNENTLDTRLWPRTSAFAEAIWNKPPVVKSALANHVILRLDMQRERLKSRGIKSELLWPEMCTMNPVVCFDLL